MGKMGGGWENPMGKNMENFEADLEFRAFFDLDDVNGISFCDINKSYGCDWSPLVLKDSAFSGSPVVLQ